MNAPATPSGSTAPAAPAGATERARDLFSNAEIARLIRPSRWRGLAAVAHCWAVIIGLWVLCVVFPHPLLIVLAVPLIGARQLGLAILQHDGAHYTLHPNKRVNDWVSEWLLNRPLFGESVVAYRKYHLDHHRFTQQSNDPDLHLSAKFPITPSSFRRKAWRDLSGQTGWKQYGRLVRSALSKGSVDAGNAGPGAVSGRITGFWSRLGPNLAINLVFLGAFAAAGAAHLYVLLWLLPAFTWERFITRLRNIGEHSMVPDNDDRLRNTRTVPAGWLARAFIAPYRVSYHLEHHLLVSAPFYRLPLAHKLLLGKGLGERMEILPDYFSVLRVACSKPEAA